MPVKSNPEVLDFKWHDWCESLGMTYSPHILSPLWSNEDVRGFLGVIKHKLKKLLVKHQLQKVMRNGQPNLSNRAVLKKKVNDLLCLLGEFKSDVESGKFLV